MAHVASLYSGEYLNANSDMNNTLYVKKTPCVSIKHESKQNDTNANTRDLQSRLSELLKRSLSKTSATSSGEFSAFFREQDIAHIRAVSVQNYKHCTPLFALHWMKDT